MFDLVINEDHTDRELLIRLLKGLHAMALDVTKLNDAVAANAAALSSLSGKVDLLIASHADPAGQAAVDAAVTAVSSNTDVVAGLSSKVDAALAPPVVEPPPPPEATA